MLLKLEKNQMKFSSLLKIGKTSKIIIRLNPKTFQWISSSKNLAILINKNGIYIKNISNNNNYFYPLKN